MEIKSSAFEENGKIPSLYTCDGSNINPPLEIKDIPEGTNSITIICEDPDLPKEVKDSMGIDVFDHWVSFNISPSKNYINEDEEPGIRGKNSAGAKGYAGPCPPKQYEPKEHRYIFKVYALDKKLDLQEGSSKEDVQKEMEGHIIKSSELTCKYERE